MPTLYLKKSLLLLLVLLSHLLSVIAPANASMQARHSILQNADLAPICNGTGKIRWIKLSDYYQTGKITLVEPAVINGETNDSVNNNCPICSLFTQLDDDYALVSIPLIVEPANYPFHYQFTQRYFNQEVASANSRAPPLFS